MLRSMPFAAVSCCGAGPPHWLARYKSCSRIRYWRGLNMPSQWSMRSPVTLCEAISERIRQWVSAKTAGFSMRRPTMLFTSKKRR